MSSSIAAVIFLSLSFMSVAPASGTDGASVGERHDIAGRAVRSTVPPPAIALWRTDKLPSSTHRAARVHSSAPLLRRAAVSQGERMLTGWFIRPIDGDTFAYGSQRIRVQGLNAPELADPGGFEASQRLASLLREGPVRIVPKATDRYGRTVAQVFVNDRDVASVLKGEGYAPR
jgi:endonuclease YncB( thermonuclease family)